MKKVHLDGINTRSAPLRMCGIKLVLVVTTFIAVFFIWRLPQQQELNSAVPTAETVPGAPHEFAEPATLIVAKTSQRVGAEPTAPTVTGDAAREQLWKAGQYESLGAVFQAARYAVERIDPAGPHSRGAEYFAANPRQQFRAWFSKDGVELAGGHPVAVASAPKGRKDAAGRSENATSLTPWNLALRLDAVGRSDALNEVVPGEVRGQASRVETAGNDATMWFENRQDGLEQGFTLHRRPDGVGKLELVLNVGGDVRAELLDGEQGIRFREAGGAEVLRYTGLKAWDAAGRLLAAQMGTRGGDVVLSVADGGARYPVTIDPLFTSPEARLAEESGAGDYFGYSVALDGDTAVIGAPFDDTALGEDVGCAYVFVRSTNVFGGLSWNQQVKLTASTPMPHSFFGYSVAVSGDTVLVGAYNAPAVFVFERTGMSWEETARLGGGILFCACA